LGRILYPALGSPSRPLPVQVGEGQTLTLTIRLKKGATLRGLALNEQGRAPKDALIVVTKVIPQWLLGWPDGEKSVRPDASGGWSLDSLSPGRYKIQVRGDWEIASAREVEVEVPFPAPVRLQLRSAPLPTLAGRVVTPAGRPVPGVSIGLNIDLPISNDALAGSKEKLTTDALGRFARPRVRRDARLFLRASKQGYRFVSGGNISRVRTVRGTQFKVSDLVLAPANVGEMLRVGATITGRAIYSNGQPAQVKIQLEANGDLADSLRQTVDWRGQNNGGLLGRLSASVQTGADGQFKVSGLAALPYALFVTDQRAGWFWPAHWRATSFSVPPARGREVRMPDVVLERGAFVRFRVVDRETKEELQGEMRLTYLSKSRFGTEGGPTSTFAAPPQVPGKTVPAGTFTLGVWRNPDGRIVEGAAHMWTATNRYIRYYELASPTLEVSVNGGAHQKVRDGRVSFPVVAGQTYAVTYFLHRLRATDSGQN